MDILLIIYIFALFVIFSPNLIFNYSKTNNILVVLLHALKLKVTAANTKTSRLSPLSSLGDWKYEEGLTDYVEIVLLELDTDG